MITKNCEVCQKEFKAKPNWVRRGHGRFCSRVCCGLSRRGNWGQWAIGKPGYMKGKTWSEEAKRKNSEAHKGPKSYLWKGGLSSANKLARESLDYRLWRKAVFERDGYKCTMCGDATGGNLQADHLKPFALFPELRFDVANGRTLCVGCHKTTSSYLNRNMKREQFV